jgi:hypothetical protein
MTPVVSLREFSTQEGSQGSLTELLILSEKKKELDFFFK